MLDEAQPDGLGDVGGLGPVEAASPDHRPDQPGELADQPVPRVAVPSGGRRDQLPRLVGVEHLPMVEDHPATCIWRPAAGLVVVVRPAPWDVESTKGPVLDMDWDGRELAPGARGHMATFARTLARACLSNGAQVVLSAATPWPRQAISIGDPAPLALDVVELMVASDCVVVPAGRMPSPSARAAAVAWDVERLLVAPRAVPRRDPRDRPGRAAWPGAPRHGRGAAGRCAPGCRARRDGAPRSSASWHPSDQARAGPAGSNSEPGRPPAAPR